MVCKPFYGNTEKVIKRQIASVPDFRKKVYLWTLVVNHCDCTYIAEKKTTSCYATVFTACQVHLSI